MKKFSWVRSGRISIISILFSGAALASLFCISGCGNSGNQIPDVSNININLQTYRFDKDLYSIDTNHVAKGLQLLKEKYPDFLNYYLDTVRQYGIHGNFSDTSRGGIDSLRIDLTFKDFVELEDTIIKHYLDNKDIDKELSEGFQFMKYYIPGYTVPRIYYLNMGLSGNWSSFPVDNNTICIGLDMFLGEQYPFYRSIGVSAYMLSHFRRQYIPVSLFNTVYQTIHPFSQEDKTLLDLMIQRGKEQYFLHKVLPHLPDSVIFGFRQDQLKWCDENEGMVYNFFIHQKLLYNKEGHNILPYVYDGPFAKDMEAPSDPVKYTPGNIGTWLGYRIVCAWIAQHPKTSLDELLKLQTDPPRFLEEAKYRPK